MNMYSHGVWSYENISSFYLEPTKTYSDLTVQRVIKHR